MAPRKPISPDEFAQRSLDGADSGDTRARLREIAEHRDNLVEISEGRDRWRWLRGGIKTFIIWAGAGLAAFAAFREQIIALFSRTGGP